MLYCNIIYKYNNRLPRFNRITFVSDKTCEADMDFVIEELDRLG